MAQPDKGCRIGNDDAGGFQGNEGKEEADTGRDCTAQRFRNPCDEPAANAGYGQQQEDAAGDEDGAERLLPGEAHRGHDREGKEGVEAHPGRHADGPVGHHRHDEPTRALQ